MLLLEKTTQGGQIIESNRQNLPDGVLLRVTYPICRFGIKNANGRVYERKVWEKVLGDKTLGERMQNRCLYGAPEHPELTQPNLKDTSHIIIETKINDSDNTVYQTMDVLDTEYGRIIETLLRAKCRVGVSTRAEGELEEAKDDLGERYMRVIPESYQYVTTDFTADPSTVNPYPVAVERRVVQEIKTGLSNGNISGRYACALLESMQSTEAKELCKSIQESQEKDMSMKFKVNDSVTITEGTHKGKTGRVVSIQENAITIDVENTSIVVEPGHIEINTQDTAPAAIPTAEPLPAADAEPLPAADAEPLIDEPADKPDTAASIDKLAEEETPAEQPAEEEKVAEEPTEEVTAEEEAPVEEEEEEEEEVKESKVAVKPVSSPAKYIRKLKIREAASRASAEKAQELLERLDVKTKGLLAENILLKKQLATRRVKESKEVTALREKLETTFGAVKHLKARLAEMKKQVDNLKTQAKKDKEAACDAEKKVKAVEESAQKDLIKAYVKTKTEHCGTKLQRSTLALLESCQTTAEVDKVFDQVSEAVYSEALLERTVDTIMIQKPVDPARNAVRSKIRAAFSTM